MLIKITKSTFCLQILLNVYVIDNMQTSYVSLVGLPPVHGPIVLQFYVCAGIARHLDIQASHTSWNRTGIQYTQLNLQEGKILWTLPGLEND